jgi:hypothetical protein
LRSLELAEALCPQADQNWLVPAGWFVRRDSPLLHGVYLSPPPTFPWLVAPLTSWWLDVHPDPMRTSGCCGLSFRPPDTPNLLCGCGHEVGIGYKDCIGPHWYALHESVVREDTVDDAPPLPISDRLGRMRERVEAPITWTAHNPGGRGAWFRDVTTWHEARHLGDIRVEVGGGIDAPMLVMTSPQLPEGSGLIVPIPWWQLVRHLVLAEQPWGEIALPLLWKTAQHQVHLTRRKRRLLLTLWEKGDAAWAVTISPKAWRAAWVRLRG